MKNRDTGLVAFRVFEQGNKKTDCIEIEDEASMLEYVLKKSYGVRARTLPISSSGHSKKREGIYKIAQRSITDYQLI